jgi:hypothetical protein
MVALRSRLVLLALAAASCFLPFAGARGQVRVLDEGSFTIFRGETRVGREDFAIRSTADAAGPVAAQGTVAIETRRLLPALAATTRGEPVSYQLEARDGRTVTDRWTVQVAAGRAVSRRRAAAGESSSEFPVPAGALLLDDDVAHHAWFLVRAIAAGRAPALPVVRPRAAEANRVEVVARGADSVAVGGRWWPAQRWDLQAPWAGGSRSLWTDAAGHLLQVTSPERGLRYVRDEAPAPAPAP